MCHGMGSPGLGPGGGGGAGPIVTSCSKDVKQRRKIMKHLKTRGKNKRKSKLTNVL